MPYNLATIHCFMAGHTNFGLYNVGESLSITCSDPTASNVEWIDSNGTVITSNPSTSAVLSINQVTDALHAAVYTCRLHVPVGVYSESHTIIITGEL